MIWFTNQQNVLKLSYFVFSTDLSKAYSSYYLAGEKKGLKWAHRVYQCYYCNKFFNNSNKQKRHTKNCSGIPGIVYNFNNQILISYQDNFNAKGDVPFVVTSILKLLLPLLSLQIQNKKNVCCFIRNDCCFSSIVRFRSHHNSKEFCPFYWTAHNSRLFY